VAYQPGNEGAADADAQTEEGQAKEGARRVSRTPKAG